jgi:hypothetical protein
VLQAWDSELDQAFAVIEQDTLYVLLTGNLGAYVAIEPSHDHSQFVFIDTDGGGQHQVVNGSLTDLERVQGLTFDAGLSPGFALISAWSGSDLNETFCRMPAGVPGTADALGFFTWSTASGSRLSGGNPDGIRVAIDNTNLQGVDGGCYAGVGGGSSGATATTGIEWAVPLAALGSPGCLRICAFLFDGNFVSNQVLAPVPVGLCSLGSPAAVNFSSLEGDQFFSVCAGVTPARAATWGRLKLLYR